MRAAGELVRALAEHNSLVGDDACANDWIGRGSSEAATRLLDRPPHPPNVVYHFS
jgi:hypothetical protein